MSEVISDIEESFAKEIFKAMLISFAANAAATAGAFGGLLLVGSFLKKKRDMKTKKDPDLN